MTTRATALRMVPLAEVVEFRRGLTYRKSDEVERSSNAVLRANNVDLETGRLDLSDIRYISDKVNVPASKQIVGGSLLICTASGSRSHLGKVAYIDGDAHYAFGGFMGLLVPRSEVLGKYIYYFTRSKTYVDFLDTLSAGANINNLRFADLGQLLIPVPPLEWQSRIVAALDQAFAALDRARANAEANLADAQELFGAALSGLSRSGSPSGRQPLRLGSIVTRLTNGYVGPIKNVYVDAGVPYLLARHVRDNTLNFDGKTYISPAFNEKHKKSKLKAGDVLLVQSGHIGHSAVVPQEHEGHNCHAMIVITPIASIVSGAYLSLMFNTPRMRARFEEIRSGSTVPHLTCKMVKELTFDIPPRPVQDQIVAQAADLRHRTQVAMSQYRSKLSDLAALRQSLLQKAFAGELA